MISILLVAQKKQEQTELIEKMRDVVAHLGDEKIDVRAYLSAEEAETAAVDQPHDFQLAVVDVSVFNGLEFVKAVRAKEEEVIITIIAGVDVSPMTYMNAAVRAENLLLKPWQAEELDRVMMDTFSLYQKRVDKGGDEKAFLLENADGKQLIPHKDIYYFEARNKKIYLRTQSMEYGMYGTLEKIMETLPEEYIQSHRSYVINKRNLRAIKLSQNMLYMLNDIMVPLSRSYKTNFKELIHEARA